MNKLIAKISLAISNYRVARRETGISLIGQGIIRSYARKMDKQPDGKMTAKQIRRGQRIVARGTKRIRRRNSRKCWVEVTDKGREIQVFLARYGTGYPAELPYAEAVKLATQLNEHGSSKTPVEITVSLGFGHQTLRLDGKLIASARDQLNAIIVSRVQAELNESSALEVAA